MSNGKPVIPSDVTLEESKQKPKSDERCPIFSWSAKTPESRRFKQDRIPIRRKLVKQFIEDKLEATDQIITQPGDGDNQNKILNNVQNSNSSEGVKEITFREKVQILGDIESQVAQLVSHMEELEAENETLKQCNCEHLITSLDAFLVCLNMLQNSDDGLVTAQPSQLSPQEETFRNILATIGQLDFRSQQQQKMINILTQRQTRYQAQLRQLQLQIQRYVEKNSTLKMRFSSKNSSLRKKFHQFFKMSSR
ncbi:uncharacterized protein LOC129749405 isoform X2 [Uranotaenia lowii]|uniref:uncharacterized protein LOC129749405 isoform X2 n=1 Tax=Uranotaenia lowii TaxID=190385 RepID=UPI00247938DF|nr:uncharacterized protein LOC129749405 isoform X2 [Uranotaenia lowii]